MEMEHVNFVGQVSTIRRSLTSKDADLLSHSYNINEGNTVVDFISTPFKQMLIKKHTVEKNNGGNEGQFLLEHIFGFCKTFKTITKNLGFHLTLKTNDLQYIFFHNNSY